MGDFVDTPMSPEFVKQGRLPEGGPGEYNGEKTGPFGAYKRTPSPNAVPEKTLDGRIPNVSGERDQF